MTGEYFVSLKNFKIPLKSVSKSAPFDVNNPPPPGTEDESTTRNEYDSYVSPLAMINRPSAQQIEAVSLAPPPPPPPPQTSSITPIQSSTKSSLAQDKPNKRSSLFCKLFIRFVFVFVMKLLFTMHTVDVEQHFMTLITVLWYSTCSKSIDLFAFHWKIKTFIYLDVESIFCYYFEWHMAVKMEMSSKYWRFNLKTWFLHAIYRYTWWFFGLFLSIRLHFFGKKFVRV